MFPFSDRGHLWKAEPDLVLGCLLSTLAKRSELYPSLQLFAFLREHQRPGVHPNAACTAFAKNMPFSSKVKFALSSSCSEERKPVHRIYEEGNCLCLPKHFIYANSHSFGSDFSMFSYHKYRLDPCLSWSSCDPLQVHVALRVLQPAHASQAPRSHSSSVQLIFKRHQVILSGLQLITVHELSAHFRLRNCMCLKWTETRCLLARCLRQRSQERNPPFPRLIQMHRHPPHFNFYSLLVKRPREPSITRRNGRVVGSNAVASRTLEETSYKKKQN